MTDAQAIHRDVQRRFVWTADKDQFGRSEDWRVPQPAPDGTIRDDCDGFVLYCHHLLRDEAGIPEGRMYPVVCKTEVGDWHVVLVCEADGGQEVLDNRQRRVVSLRELRRAGYSDFYRPSDRFNITADWELLEV